MFESKRREQTMKRIFSILAMTAAAAMTAQAAYILLPNGNRIDGTDIRARPNGDIILTTSAGQRTFTRGQYAKAFADKPAAYDQASAAAGQGNFDQAIQILDKIIADYRFLEWDNQARNAKARVFMLQEDFDSAVTAYEELFRNAPDAKTDEAIGWGYREALLGAKQYDTLVKDLNDIIKSGSRPDAARAQVMRGDVEMARNRVEPAVMDYLRSAILFENVASVQPEALFKAASGLEQLRDARSRDMYQKLVEKYPSSEYAQKARAKM